MAVLKWSLYIAIAIAGTVASREIHETWTPHKIRNHVWTTRGDSAKHWREFWMDIGMTDYKQQQEKTK